jgi:hypothetical protein
VSLDGRGSGQSDSVGCEPRHCASKDTLSEPDLAHVCKCVLGRKQLANHLAFVPSSTFLPSFVPILVSSSDDDSEDENPPPPHLPPDESIEHEPVPVPSLPRWLCSTREAVDDLTGDPRDQC